LPDRRPLRLLRLSTSRTASAAHRPQRYLCVLLIHSSQNHCPHSTQRLRPSRSG
jgi:hypothetical protein